MLIANYDLFHRIMTQFNYIVNNKLSFLNPEVFNYYYLSRYNIKKTNKIKIYRIRADGTKLNNF